MNGTLGVEGVMRLPLLGEVAAGQPLEVFSVEESLDVPTSLWSGRRVFALRVRGHSMIDAGIRHGDYLIVEPCETADNGRTVVVEVDGRVTVKKLHRDAHGEIRLQPANSEMLPLVVRGEHVRVRGVVIGVLRKYGFGGDRPQPAEAGARPVRPAMPARLDRRACRDGVTLELALNAIDAHLARWRALLDQPRVAHGRERAQMASMGRDLQALRDWCARTSKPGLRRALLADANRVMDRMQRFLAARSLELPDVVLH